jgi:hypothetical protein
MRSNPDKKTPHCCVASSHIVTSNSRCQTEFICHGDKRWARRCRFFFLNFISVFNFPKIFLFFYFLHPQNPVSFFVIHICPEGTVGGEWETPFLLSRPPPLNKSTPPCFSQIWQSAGHGAWYKVWKIVLPFIYRLISLFMHSFMYRLSIYLSFTQLSNYSSPIFMPIRSFTDPPIPVYLPGYHPQLLSSDSIIHTAVPVKAMKAQRLNRVTYQLILNFGTWWLVTLTTWPLSSCYSPPWKWGDLSIRAATSMEKPPLQCYPLNRERVSLLWSRRFGEER